ncbi:MAG: hypothetical protein RDU20_12175 [Desulfomonilaceae bacterium]|nr:hypothetical protein [Desulfomonilaceae bacterium]
MKRSRDRDLSLFLRAIPIVIAVLMLLLHHGEPLEAFDLMSGIIDSPEFKGKDPLSNLRTAADLLQSNKLRQTDISFFLLDWGDRYLRETSDPLERLKKWSTLTQDKTLSHLKLPRDFLNRVLLAEYLVRKTRYLHLPPAKRLDLIRRLQDKDLVDWSVALAYSRLYAGAVVLGAKGYESRSPAEALATLKKLSDEGLIGRHYRVPTEALLISEALALDESFETGTPLDRLMKLRDLEHKGLIAPLNKKETEKLPAWRLLVSDPSFLRGQPKVKEERLDKLLNDGLISPATHKDLVQVFRPQSMESALQASPAPLPKEMAPLNRQP